MKCLYCDHLTLNAALNYCAENTRQSCIHMKTTMKLPDRLPITYVKVCSIVWNIFDNAINTCREIQEVEQWIDRTISCLNTVRFGIVASNSFSGKVKKGGNRYLSMYNGSSGIVLTSVTSIVEQYDGTATFDMMERCLSAT